MRSIIREDRIKRDEDTELVVWIKIITLTKDAYHTVKGDILAYLNERLHTKRQRAKWSLEKYIKKAGDKQFKKWYKDDMILSFKDFIDKYVHLFCGVQTLSFKMHIFL